MKASLAELETHCLTPPVIRTGVRFLVFSKPSTFGGGPGAVLPIRGKRDRAKFEYRISKSQTNTKSEFSNGYLSLSNSAGGFLKTSRTAGIAAASAVRMISGSEKAKDPQSTTYRKVHPNDCRLMT